MDMTPLKVGDPAPDFRLKNQLNEEIVLSSLRGKKGPGLVSSPGVDSGM
jgi:peroxiredoxin